MTPEKIEAFFTLHRDLPREGPGEAADVIWAVDQLGLSGPLSVLDAACGPGADMVTLAETLPQAKITGIEKTPHFATEARARVRKFAPRMSVIVRDMAEPGGPFDLIWCAGAIYFLGVTEGLKGWRSALHPGAAVVFSEPVLLDLPPSPDVAEFWKGYPAISDLAGIVARVEAAGFRVQGHRILVGAPWAAYINPLQDRVTALRAGEVGGPLMEVLDDQQTEIDGWKAAQDQIAYALLIVTPE